MFSDILFAKSCITMPGKKLLDFILREVLVAKSYFGMPTQRTNRILSISC